MWTKEILGTDLYHLIAAFILYSMLGWLVESMYMSLCNRKLTNRGFAFSPFCPIYGFGAVFCYLLLHPLKENIVALYLVGALLATIFEFLVGKLMIRMFGELWWDYSEKPFQYQGIICLESTVAWGFYAVGIVVYLHDYIMRFIDSYAYRTGIFLCRMILMIVLIDFIYHFVEALGVNLKEYREKVKEKYFSFKARWY